MRILFIEILKLGFKGFSHIFYEFWKRKNMSYIAILPIKDLRKLLNSPNKFRLKIKNPNQSYGFLSK